jgi:hypothetical protein
MSLLRIALGVRVHEFVFVLFAIDLKPSGVMDLRHGHAHSLRRHPAVGVERAGLRLDFADFERLLRACRGVEGQRHRSRESKRCDKTTAEPMAYVLHVSPYIVYNPFCQ